MVSRFHSMKERIIFHADCDRSNTTQHRKRPKLLDANGMIMMRKEKYLAGKHEIECAQCAERMKWPLYMCSENMRGKRGSKCGHFSCVRMATNKEDEP